MRALCVLFLMVSCCCHDMNVRYCGMINQGLTGPVVMVAKSEDCDVVLVDSSGVVLGIPGKYAVAKALCESMAVGDTITRRVSWE